jgi:hypothetical protein
VLVAGSYLFGNCAPGERKRENQHSYDAHAILPGQTIDAFTKKAHSRSSGNTLKMFRRKRGQSHKPQ